jgi:NAD(P)-dependent dehydrogenase (short-subunit alcohol dehydrogenase family)
MLVPGKQKPRVVLITGAGRGIGKRLALGFAGQGDHLGLLARSKAELNVTLLEIQQRGGTGLIMPVDVRNAEALSHQVQLLGDLDILICAAGVQGCVGPFATSDAKQWAEVLETNLVGVANTIRAVLPQMIQRRRGKIIVLSGGGSNRARPNFSGYAASKAGLARLVETIAEEVADHNVQLNALAPGGTYTAMTDEILQAGEAAGETEIQDAKQVRLTGGVPMEKQVDLALWLASDASNHITGRLLHVNDDWKRLARERIDPHLFTLRRVQKSQH